MTNREYITTLHLGHNHMTKWITATMLYRRKGSGVCRVLRVDCGHFPKNRWIEHKDRIIDTAKRRVLGTPPNEAEWIILDVLAEFR